MQQRMFGKTGRMVSEIGLGTWQLGARWGEPFDLKAAMETLEAAAECGVNFIDTADIYNDGNSELAIGKLIARYPGRFFVTTKCGRGLNPHTAEGYTPDCDIYLAFGYNEEIMGGPGAACGQSWPPRGGRKRSVSAWHRQPNGLWRLPSKNCWPRNLSTRSPSAISPGTAASTE